MPVFAGVISDQRKLKYILLFSGTPVVAVKAEGGVSKLGCAKLLQLQSDGWILSVGVLRRMSAFPRERGGKK